MHGYRIEIITKALLNLKELQLTTIFILLLGCNPIEHNFDVAVSKKDGHLNDSHVSETDEDLFVVAWDEESGFSVHWPKDKYTHLRLETADGEYIAQMNTIEGFATFGNLEKDEYIFSLSEQEGGQSSHSIHQYNGANRLLYRSEVPISSAQMGFNSGQNSEPFGSAMDVWGTDNIALLAGGTHKETSLLITDVTNPKSPEILLEMEQIGFVRDVKTGDDLLFTAVDVESDGCSLCDDIGVRIFDFEDPSNPVLLSTIGHPASSVHNLSYNKGYLYICSMFEQKLVVFDVRDPSNPQRISSWAASSNGPSNQFHSGYGGPHDITAVGDRLYVAHVFGFSILDISDPANLVEIGSQDVQMGMHNVWPNKSQNLLVGSQEIVDGPMTLWDISDPTNIQQIHSLSTGEDRCIHNAYFSGDTIFAAWYVDGVYAFELDEEQKPVQRGHFDTYEGAVVVAEDDEGNLLPPISGAWGVWPFGEHLLVGDTMRGLLVLDYIPPIVSVSINQ